MMRNVCFKKGLIVGIIVLFIGVSVQPGMGTEIPDKIEVEPKDYLFQTIIDISNNPDVRDLVEQVKNNDKVFKCDYNFVNVYLKLLLRNPRELFSMLFTKPSMTYEYLDLIYTKGFELLNVIGENEALEIIDSVESTNPDFFNEFNYIVMNDEELSYRISILNEMNEELNTNPPLKIYPIICAILLISTIPLIIIMNILDVLSIIFHFIPILSNMFDTWSFIVFDTLVGIGLLMMLVFNCFRDWEPWP